MCVVAEYPAGLILAMRGDHIQTFEVGGEHYPVKMDSARYRLFAKSPVCVSCNAKGTVMRLEYHRSGRANPTRQAHFNLYAFVDGVAVLMTKDHIVPRSRGGADNDENYQPMCSPCNKEKGCQHELPGQDSPSSSAQPVDVCRSSRTEYGQMGWGEAGFSAS